MSPVIPGRRFVIDGAPAGPYALALRCCALWRRPPPSASACAKRVCRLSCGDNAPGPYLPGRATGHGKPPGCCRSARAGRRWAWPGPQGAAGNRLRKRSKTPTSIPDDSGSTGSRPLSMNRAWSLPSRRRGRAKLEREALRAFARVPWRQPRAIHLRRTWGGDTPGNQWARYGKPGVRA